MKPVDRFTCEDVFRKLDDFVDREIVEEEARLVSEHLETCAVCLGMYRFEDGVLKHLREKIRRIPAPPDLLQNISRLIEDEGKSGKSDGSS